MDIVITPTSKAVHQVERHVIAEIRNSGRIIITRDSLDFLHICKSEELDSGDKYSQCAEVGLLTRNIKISSAPTDNFYGGRMLIGLHIVLVENMYNTFRG